MAEASSGNVGDGGNGASDPGHYYLDGSPQKIVGHRNVMVQSKEGNVMVNFHNCHSKNCQLENDPPHEPASKTADSYVANVPYNIRMSRIQECLDKDKVLLTRLKTFCSSPGDDMYGVPSNQLDEVDCGKKFIHILTRCKLVNPHNVFYLQYLLTKASNEGSQCMELIDDLKVYAEERKDDTLYLQTPSRSIANGVYQTEIEIRGEVANFANYDLETFLNVLKERLGIPRELVSVNGIAAGCMILVLQFPTRHNGNDIKDVWKKEVTQEKLPDWITDWNVNGIHIAEDMEYIMYNPFTKEGSMNSDTALTEEFLNESSDTSEDTEELERETKEIHYPFESPEKFAPGNPPNLPGVASHHGEGVTIVFHTIVPPEYGWSSGNVKLGVRMAGPDFGSMNQDCVEMKEVREVKEGYYYCRGSVQIKRDMLKDVIHYRYLATNRKLAKHNMREDLKEYAHAASGQLNRCLRVTDDRCIDGGRQS